MRILPFLFLLLIAIGTFAKDKPLVSAEPSWLFKIQPDLSRQPDMKKIGNGYYLELLDQQFNLHNETYYAHYIRRIVNESGVQNASEISVYFSPEYQTLTFHYIRVIRNGEVIDRLRPNEIKVIQEETDAEEHQYNNRRRAFLILKDIRKDDRIEAAYSVTGFNPVYNNRFTTSIYLSNDNPVLNYYQTIIAEPTRKLRFTYYGNAARPEESMSGDSKIYHWKNPPLSLWESLSGAPSWFDPYPSITVTEFTSWREVADWAVNLNNNYATELPPALKIKMAAWRKQADGDNDEFARLALRYVQDHIRYLGLEIGVNTHKPHSPAEVIRNGYGDCKDKALLLATILRSENIAAWVALVNTDIRGELVNRATSPNEFNHAIVAIEKPGSYKYVDPTLSYQRGDLSDVYTPAYHFALLLKPGETDLRYVTPSENNIARIFERLNVTFNDTSTLTVNSTYRGSKANAVRSYLATSSEKDIESSYTDYYSSTFDGIQMSKSIAYEDDSVNNVMKVNEAYTIPGIWTDEDSTRKYFLTYARPIDETLTDPAGKSNKYPIALGFPTEVHYTLDIQMPEDWNIDLDTLHIKTDAYEFNFAITYQGSLISMQYSLVTFKDHIPATAVEQYKKDYKKISDAIQYRFSYGGNTPKAGGGTAKGVNFVIIGLTLAVIAVAVFSFIRLNRRTVDVIYDRDSGHKLGGWTIVLGISLVLGCLLQVYGLFQGDYFSAGSFDIWNTYGSGFVLTVLAEFIFSLIWILSSFAVTYWYLQRRDIFPSMFNWYVTMLIVTQAILFLLYQQFADDPEFKGTIGETARELFRLLVYGAVWCTYLARSTRVKGTFLKAFKG